MRQPDLTPPADSPASASPTQQTSSNPGTPISLGTATGSSQPAPAPQPQGYTGVGRRSHKKSRTGCSICKARKIKTYRTLCADPCLWEFWRDDVVQLGFSCDYIMRALLAVSALHLAFHRPDRRDFYIEEGVLLHQQASRLAMLVVKASTKIDKQQAASFFLFSMLTIFFALASPRRSNSDGTFFIGESGFPDWAFLLSGGKSVMDALGEPGPDTVAGPFLRYGYTRWNAQRAALDARKHHSLSDPTSTNDVSAPLPPYQPLLGPLRSRVHAAVSDPALLGTYTRALDQLELSLASRDLPDAPRDSLDAMVWLWMVSDEFMPLLRAPTQEAVAIFAHFGVLLKHHETHWWLKGWGDHIAWIEWPLSELGWVDGQPPALSPSVAMGGQGQLHEEKPGSGYEVQMEG
ncbi:uncharacterized protein C8A04DRAFT_39636 [Dichotomopilus funicola]|uniref:Uncharacterized protein n=1 Tax=Dichotomopilus funicola TaxID=1934379 RepID=A0AAN6UX93_9PEZI|nr:hypothetical protein C8A04DRAFT_39636 [Dichotomopilus funicola]